MMMITTHFNLELIDTLWNVNWTPLVDEADSSIELIDTLWNVNIYDRRH